MSQRVRNYKEIAFGILFGLGASLIDISMHSSMENKPWIDEFIHPSLLMLVYRLMFLLLGITLGVLLWQRNRVERDSRRYAALLGDLRRDLAGPSMIVHTNLQLMLTRHHTELPPPVRQIVELSYENSKVVQQVLANVPAIEEGTASELRG
jgi:hypothetical protein